MYFLSSSTLAALWSNLAGFGYLQHKPVVVLCHGCDTAAVCSMSILSDIGTLSLQQHRGLRICIVWKNHSFLHPRCYLPALRYLHISLSSSSSILPNEPHPRMYTYSKRPISVSSTCNISIVAVFLFLLHLLSFFPVRPMGIVFLVLIVLVQ